ncbi:MAG: caspase family protein [Planctomycetota bacterium]
MNRHKAGLVTALVAGAVAAVLHDSAGASGGAAGPVSTAPQLVIDAKGLTGDAIVSVDVSSDGRLVAAASGKEVRVWSVETQELLFTLRGYREPGGFHVGAINVVRFFPGSERLAVGVSDNTDQGSTRVYDLSNPGRFDLLRGHVGCTRGVAIAGDGQRLVTFGCDRSMRVMRNTGGGWRQQATRGVASMLSAGEGLFDFVDNRHLLWLHPNYQLAECYDIGPSIRSVRLRPPAAISAWQRSLTAARRPFAATAKQQGKVTLDVRTDGDPSFVVGGTSKEAATGRSLYWVASYATGDATPRAVYRGHNYSPTASAIRPVAAPGQPPRVVAASGDKHGQVHVWDAADATRLARFAPKNRQFYGVRWSGDGRRLLLSAVPHPHGKYNYNRYGPTTHEFDLQTRQLRLAPGDASSDGDGKDDAGPLLTLRDKSEELVIAARRAGARVDLHVRRGERWANMNPWETSKTVGIQWRWDRKHFGNAYCYTPSPGGSASEGPMLFVGTDSGALEELEVMELSTGERMLAGERRFVGHTATVTGAAVSPDGRTLASCSWDGTVRLWSLDPVPSNGEIDFHADGASVTIVKPKSNAAAAGLRVGDVITEFDNRPFFERFQHMAKGAYRPGQNVRIDFLRGGAPRSTTIRLASAAEYIEPYLTVFFASDGEWVAYTPRGFYDTSPGGERYVGWHLNRERHEPATLYGVEQFRESLYRPDVIDAILDRRDEAASVEVADAALKSKPAAYPVVADAPTIEFSTPRSPHLTTAASVDVTIKARAPAASPLRRVDLRVGSLPAEVEYVGERAVGSRVETVYRATVRPPAGVSFLTATANTRGMASAPARLEVRRPQAVAEDNTPRLHVLAIGISQYNDAEIRLGWAGQDARDFARVWEAQAGRFYASVETRVVADGEATVAGIRRGMDWLANATSERPFDVAMIYLAGHGVFNDRGVWHFGGCELDLDDLRNTAVSEAELAQLIDRELKGRLLMFADTCHAGGFRERPHARRTHPQHKSPWLGSSYHALVSCLSRQESVESDLWQNGAFTEALIAAMTTGDADRDRDGRLSFDELQAYVRRETKRLANLVDNEQTPAIHVPPFSGEVDIASAP